jgi:uncharacterized protein YqfA (UPF0365 family)
MTKRERSVLFMLGATVFNVLLTAIIFVALIVLYSLTLGRLLSAPSAALAIGLCFILALVATAIIYRKVLEAMRKRIDFEASFGLKR